ncbi:EAL domain-containing protein [Eubacterium sp. 1001713B170207_170306_E7]|uniref:bifunctional diguanylate cyclase/phosphodiesterase n=1 Tax=Eubacterium sp. 1001713B170207_170306_E7 TaxID=2787097 RepID=UPI0018983E63|nr:EAL domain-containing protein [Eubacterium sp. 1001713B170207_170306_E7]
MMNKDNQYSFIKTYVIAVIICIGFLAFSLLFIFHIMSLNQQESANYLNESAKQSQTAVEKQITGDFQTLDGIAECVGDLDVLNADQVGNLLKRINDNNVFIRMGFADKSGIIDFYDINGDTHKSVDISREYFFNDALAGRDVISRTVEDPLNPRHYINYYAVPIRHNNEVVGVLCAVNEASVLREIIDTPVFNDRGFTNIIDSNGDIIMRSVQTGERFDDVTRLNELGILSVEDQEKLNQALQEEKSLSFSYEGDDGKEMAVLEPVGVNGWFILTAAPQSIVRDYYNKTAIGTILIVLAACLIFLYLLYHQRKILTKSRNELLNAAYADPLTGQRNNARFRIDGKKVLQDSNNAPYGIWYCDIKKFKFLNDLYGYERGDKILKCLSDILLEHSRKDDLFCRVSADNFAGIRSYHERVEITEWFNDLVREISESGMDKAKHLPIDLCMGVYCTEDQSEELTLNDMIDRANMAQKSIKNQVGSQMTFYTEEIRNQTIRETEMESLGKEALENEEFVIYMQPKVNIQKGNIIAGAEALARWNSSQRGMISPGEFIPLFEKSGLVVDLDRYMFEKSCQWLRSYLDAGRPLLNVAVNVSRLGLFQEDFVEHYSAIKQKYRIPDFLLELEFTESVMLDDSSAFKDVVELLQKNGFRCSLDDFGSGYSSLNVLKNLSIDVLKLDILFFKEGTDLRREQVVIANTVAMAKELSIKTIAEGVEDMEQVEFLRGIGCDVVQGYVFSKPMPLEEFDDMLRQLNGRSIDVLKA